jgi:hypothetical protein
MISGQHHIVKLARGQMLVARSIANLEVPIDLIFG